MSMLSDRQTALIEAAKEAREVAAAVFRVLNPNQIDAVLADLKRLGIAPAFGTRLQDAIAEAPTADELERLHELLDQWQQRNS